MLGEIFKGLFIFSTILVVIAYWRRIKGILDSLTDFTKAALKDGCLKDLFSWIGWSLIIAFLNKVRSDSSNVCLTLFFYFVFVLWSVSLLGIMDSISDFSIRYVMNKLKIDSISEGKLIILMVMKIVVVTVIFFITMESAKEIIVYLFRVGSS